MTTPFHSGPDRGRSPVPLDTLSFPLWGSRLIEASAGTGKTYTIASLYVRLVLGHGAAPDQKPLAPPDILVVTFTRAATQELRDRIRRRLNEAAACFLGDCDGDDFLSRLRDDYEPMRWPACARRLQLAAEWMDEAAVSTIDAWCYRMLREHAFDSASLFDLELDVDDGALVAEATRDYWRLFIAPLATEEFQAVLQVIAAHMGSRWGAGVDCDALAGITGRWLARGAGDPAAAPPDVVLAEVRRQRDECKAKWRAWLPEIEGLLQQAHESGSYEGRKLRRDYWQGWLAKLQEWACDPVARCPFEPKAVAWTRLTPAGLAEAWKKGAPPEHPAFVAMADLRREIDGFDAHASAILVHAAGWVAQRVAELRRRRAVVSFGGLLEQLDAALGGPNGERLARTIRTQFTAALVDEFQDTNPLQYRIFDRIYDVSENDPSTLLTLIGDPKQAIYRFRGADIHAYLAARQDCGDRLYTLGSNHRSSPAMVRSVNHLFSSAERAPGQGAFLFREASDGAPGRDPVPFHPVVAAADPGQWQVEGRAAPALTLWCDTSHDKPEACAAAVAQACASEILRLLELGVHDRAGFVGRQGLRALRPHDIAILVNNRGEAARLRSALAQRGIRSVYLSDDSSVFHSAAAGEVLAWLRACAEPENGGHVRAALATPSLGLEWRQLDAFVRDEVQWEAMLERFARYKECWIRLGVLPMLRRYMHDFDVPGRLFDAQGGRGQEGERQLTDLLHLAELLQAASSTIDGEHALIRYLEERIERGGEAGVDGDASRMRLESDAGLVRVVTVHKSKGLEYPLVFYPYAYHGRPSTRLELPLVYRDRNGVDQILASLTDVDEATLDHIRATIEHERLAEDMRKLYVALTRARYATWVALAPVPALAASAMGHLLGGPDACRAGALQESVATLAEGCADMSVEDFPPLRDGRFRDTGAPMHAPVWRHMHRRIDRPWGMSSYSALARLALETAGSQTSVSEAMTHFGEPAWSDADAAAAVLPEVASRDTFLEAYAAHAASFAFQAEEAAPADDTRPVIAEATGAGIHDFPRGAGPGTFLHELLEWILRQGPGRVLGDADSLYHLVERRCRSRGWEGHAAVVTEWLLDFFARPFGIVLPRAGSQRDLVLSELRTVHPEMEFWLGVRDADLPALDALVTQQFLPGRARSMIARGRLNGMLRGFIDLVFEHDGRYYVADYKSNWLGPDDSAYDTEAIHRAMLDHRYDLQSAIYLHALHRLLRSRLGAKYDYERHVGGALVFFVRGHRAVSQGLFIARPPAEVIGRMDALFHGDRASTTVGGS